MSKVHLDCSGNILGKVFGQKIDEELKSLFSMTHHTDTTGKPDFSSLRENEIEMSYSHYKKRPDDAHIEILQDDGPTI